MRTHLLSKTTVTEKICTKRDLQEADEIFLTNATSGLRHVKNFEGKEYSGVFSKKLYNDHIAPLWAS